jgi:hypothetical protein
VLVRSRVTVWPSERLARRNLEAFAAERGAWCTHRYAGSAASRTAVALSDGASAVGLRATLRGGRHDITGFVVGPAEVVLTSAGIGHAVPWALERRLLELLHRRAEAARREL